MCGGSAYSPPTAEVDGRRGCQVAIDYDLPVDPIDELDPQIPPADSRRTQAGFDMRLREGDQQPSLFPTEELLVPATLRTMRKAVAAIHAVPMRAEHSQGLNGRRLFDACILIAQLDPRLKDRQNLARITQERMSPMFETRVSDLARLAGIPGKNYERIYEELDRLFELTLQWNVVGESQEVEWKMKSHFLSAVGYGEGMKRGLVRFSIDPSVLGIVLEPSNWATLSLQAMEGLGTAASYALYANVWRYVGTQAKVTAPLPTATWIELLMGPCRYVVDDGAEKRVVDYGDFKRRHLMDAIRRVNNVPALSYTIELKEIRSGNRVARLQFKFVQKQNQDLAIPLIWPSEVVQVLTQIGLSSKEIHDLGQSRSYEEVAESLVRLTKAEERLRAKGQPLSSKKAYFQGILQNVAAGSATDEAADEAIAAEVREQQARQLQEERQAKAQQKFAEHQTDRFRENLFSALDASVRESLFRDFEAANGSSTMQTFLKKGWTPKNAPLLAQLRAWLAKEREEIVSGLLPNPEDRDFDAWLAWRATN